MGGACAGRTAVGFFVTAHDDHQVQLIDIQSAAAIRVEAGVIDVWVRRQDRIAGDGAVSIAGCGRIWMGVSQGHGDYPIVGSTVGLICRINAELAERCLLVVAFDAFCTRRGVEKHLVPLSIGG